MLPKSSKGVRLTTERIVQFPELLLIQRGYGGGRSLRIKTNILEISLRLK